jgi:phosphopantothenoylcysteine decarboxylase/phosphopantothenate--cysteine ligase
MGNSLAIESARRGAMVTLISGPVSILPEQPNIEIVKVSTAIQMFEACLSRFPEVNICIMAAAVSDYFPENSSDTKIKKEDDSLVLHLKKSADILAELGKTKKPGQVLIGFALETDNEILNAQAKLHKKNLDLIVLNSLKDAGAGFGLPTNKVTFLDKDGNKYAFELKSKAKVAEDILDFACNLIE